MSHQLFTVGVKVLFQNIDGKYLLLLKDANECKENGVKIHWDIPGGRIDEGESVDEAVKREVKEEIGIASFSKGTLLGVTISNFAQLFADNKLLLVVYEGTFQENENIILNSEHSEYKWVEKQEAVQLLVDKYPIEFLKTIFH